MALCSNYLIDDLVYSYRPFSNKLEKVEDYSGSLDGFRDGQNPDLGKPDYDYDADGNMKFDWNKGISNIDYNHLHLPVRINFQVVQGQKNIEYLYNAVGTKLSKRAVHRDNTSVYLDDTTLYLDGFQYVNNVLQFFPTSEGYVSVVGSNYNYVFNYTDHLGNVRLSYTKPSSGPITILEENHYYPFGMKHSYNSSIREWSGSVQTGDLQAVLMQVERSKYQYKYNGKEYQDELSLNLYDYGARNYDPAIGRWMNIDPMAEKYFNFTPYSYVGNMPTIAIDPDGKDIVFTQSVRDDGTRVIQMTVTGKLINQSSNAYTKEQMSAYNERISSYMKEAYSMSGSDDSGGKYEVNVSVNLTTASEDNPLSETDTAFRIVDPGNIPDFQQGGFLPEDTPGAADFNQNIVYLSTSVMDKKPREGSTTGRSSDGTGGATLERTASHETGHAGGLHHPRLNEKNLMHQTSNKNAGTKINYQQLLQMFNDYNSGLLNQGRQE